MSSNPNALSTGGSFAGGIHIETSLLKDMDLMQTANLKGKNAIANSSCIAFASQIFNGMKGLHDSMNLSGIFSQFSPPQTPLGSSKIAGLGTTKSK